MAVYGCIWLYIAVYGRIWLYILGEGANRHSWFFDRKTMSTFLWLYSCILLYMVVYGCIWLYMGVYGCIWLFLLYMALYSCVGLSMAALKRKGGELETNPICTQRVALSSRVYNCVKAQGGGAWNPLRALTQFGTIHQSAKRTADSAKTQRTRQLARQRIQNMRFPSPRSLR